MKEILQRLFRHEELSSEETRRLMLDISAGKYADEQIAALLAAFCMRSITVDELLGFRSALMETRVAIDFSPYHPIDIVGTGGDGKNTFNISTCACFVVAGAGYKVAKHGNYAATSMSGASNVMEQHGMKYTTEINRLRRSMDRCRFAYLHAPLFNPALKAVAGVRKNLGVRSFFNMLGPLVNPILPTYQLLGVYNLPDEISLTDEFKVAMSDKEKIYTPEMLGFTRCREADLDGGSTPEEAARIFDAVLENRATLPQKNCVLVNAAFAIRVICPEKRVEDCLEEARESLESGKALEVLRKALEVNS